MGADFPRGVAAVTSRWLIESERAAQTCRQCSLWEGTTLVFGDGPSSGDLMLVGEAPGRREDMVGRPFVGLAGHLLDTFLFEVGIRRGDVYVTNVVKHRPTKRGNGDLKNRHPSASEVEACKPLLSQQIELLKPRLIVPLGVIATQAILGRKERIGDVHGRRFELDERTIIPTYHPAGIRGSVQRMDAFRDDFQTIADAHASLEN